MWSSKSLELFENDKALEYLAAQYKSAKPFPHIVIDDALDGYTVKRIFDTFPKPDASWWRYDNVLERKYAKDDLENESVFIRDTVAFLQSKRFVFFLEKLTGIQGLITDHTLRGAGCHAIRRGGNLAVHSDFPIHPHLKLERRINVLLYLNFLWKEEWGGHLELWNESMTECQQKIAPVFNRMVIFTTTETSYHGHPDPLQCPDDMTRKSLAFYYYSMPATQGLKEHSTNYKLRPQDDDSQETRDLIEKRFKGRIQK